MTACGVCGGGDFAPFFRAREWSSSGIYLAAARGGEAREPITILLEYCQTCGFIRQRPGSEVQLDYTGISRDTAKQLPDYARSIIASLADFGVGPDEFIVEVGANDGTFLKTVHAAGYRNLLGVEPSKRLAMRGTQAGLAIRNDYFGRSLAFDIVREHGPARAVICRHTLEHVPDIRELTQAIADVLAPGGMAFVEVPDTDWIVSDLFAHEIWDEHISYFRAGSLAALLRSVGLEPLRLERVRFRDTRNLLCWSMRPPVSAGVAGELVHDATEPNELANFQSRWDVFAARLRSAIAVAPRPLIAIGASHIQLNFLNFAGLDDCVDLLIDDDPVKAGHYAPLASAVPIQTTQEVLASVRAGTVLRTAFPYPAWEDRVCNGLALHGVQSINPYDLR